MFHLNSFISSLLWSSVTVLESNTFIWQRNTVCWISWFWEQLDTICCKCWRVNFGLNIQRRAPASDSRWWWTCTTVATVSPFVFQYSGRYTTEYGGFMDVQIKTGFRTSTVNMLFIHIKIPGFFQNCYFFPQDFDLMYFYTCMHRFLVEIVPVKCSRYSILYVLV